MAWFIFPKTQSACICVICGSNILCFPTLALECVPCTQLLVWINHGPCCAQLFLIRRLLRSSQIFWYAGTLNPEQAWLK